VLADAPAAAWRLGERSGTAAASATGAAPGTYTGAVTLGIGGLLARDSDAAASFDGVDDAVSVPAVSALPNGDTFTLEAWVNRRAHKHRDGLVSKGTGGYELYVNSSNQLTLARAGYGDIVRSTTTLAAGRTYHVAATKQGATVRLYVDGIDRTGTVTNRTMTANTNPLTLGAGTSFLKGTLDEVAVYTRALSAADVARHNAAGR
jgi:hypothetical protein